MGCCGACQTDFYTNERERSLKKISCNMRQDFEEWREKSLLWQKYPKNRASKQEQATDTAPN